MIFYFDPKYLWVCVVSADILEDHIKYGELNLLIIIINCWELKHWGIPQMYKLSAFNLFYKPYPRIDIV